MSLEDLSIMLGKLEPRRRADRVEQPLPEHRARLEVWQLEQVETPGTCEGRRPALRARLRSRHRA